MNTMNTTSTNTTVMNTTAMKMNTTLLGQSPSSLSSLVPTIGASVSEENDTISEDDEQQIKVEKDEKENNTNLNYDDLVVALWNIVEHNHNNVPNSTRRNHKQSLHSMHSTQSALNTQSTHHSTFDDDDESAADNDILPFSISPTSSSNSNSKQQQQQDVFIAKPKRKRERETPHVSVLEYCPNYLSYDARARKESKERISSHLKERQKLVMKCIEKAMADLDALRLQLCPSRSSYITFEDNNDILSGALEQLKEQIDAWDGVQIKQCKKEQRDGTKIVIDTWQKFAKKAKNHQDQTSWKISGDYFFAPYIKKVSLYIDRYCNCIINISPELRLEIIKLGSISFAINLLNGKIKFHRTKLKPLIRHRTLVKSSGIHIELENLFSKLTIRKFIQNAKAERKENDGKSNIIAGDFYDKLIKYVHNEYAQQKEYVRRLVNEYKVNKLLPPIPILPILNNNIPPIPACAIPAVIHNNNNNNNNNVRNGLKRKRNEANMEKQSIIVSKKRKISIETKPKYSYNVVKYRIDFEYILSSCNGSCGNRLGRFIAHILSPNNNAFCLSKESQLDVLAHKFGEYHNKMRDYLLDLLRSANINNNGGIWMDDELFCSLQNESMYISNILRKDGERCIAMFIESFQSLLRSNRGYILEKLAHKSCKRCDVELMEEVGRNNVSINLDHMHAKIEMIKNTSAYYRCMKLLGNGLRNNEIIAIYILIKHSNLIYFDAKDGWCNVGNSCKWKQLFSNICSAIKKIYKIFVYKNNRNNKQFPNQLHTSENAYNTIQILCQTKSHQHQTKVMVDIKNALYNGKLIAAPIDWIFHLKHENNTNNCENKKDIVNFENNMQWISLPTLL